MNRQALAGSLSLLSTALAVHAQTRVWFVDASAPSGGDGSSWTTAMRDLQAALDAAAVPDAANLVREVRIARGTYVPAGLGPAGEGFRANNYDFLSSAACISIFGGFGGRAAANPDARDPAGTPTILSGDLLGDDGPGFTRRDDNAGAVLLVRASWGENRVLVDGLTIRAGSARDPGMATGGGLYVDADSEWWGPITIVSNCVIEDCEADLGGGAYVRGGGIVRCTIRHCRATLGGGVYLAGGLLERSRVTGNAAIRGGGVYGNPGFFGLRSCVLAENFASESGGGAHVLYQMIESCLVVANETAGAGGGVALEGLPGNTGAETHLCTIVGNRAAWGGGVVVTNGRVVNSIVVGNSATIAGNQAAMGLGDLLVARSILQGGLAGVHRALGGTPMGQNELDVEPRFLDADGPDDNPLTWADNDYRLADDSPAIDAALDVSWNRALASLITDRATDVAGLPRYVGYAPDLGCHEAQRDCNPDFNRDGNADQGDVRDLTYIVAGAPNLTGLNPDFNGDGNVDQDDVAALIAAIAGAGCP